MGEKTLHHLGVTQFLFITTQLTAIIWVSVSYLIAIYATVKLKEPFPVVELSQQAMTTILGGVGMKTVSNIFEHNNGGLFGRSTKSIDDTQPTI